MKQRGLYSTAREEIRKRVEGAGMSGIFARGIS